MHHLTTRVRNRPPPPSPPLPTANRLHSDGGDRERAEHIPFRRRRRRRPPTPAQPSPGTTQPCGCCLQSPGRTWPLWLLQVRLLFGSRPKEAKGVLTSLGGRTYVRVSRNGAAQKDQGPLAIGAYVRPRASGREPSPPGMGREGGRSDQTRRPGWRPGRAERPGLFTTKRPNASLGTWHVPRGWGFKVCLGLTGRQSGGGVGERHSLTQRNSTWASPF